MQEANCIIWCSKQVASLLNCYSSGTYNVECKDQIYKSQGKDYLVGVLSSLDHNATRIQQWGVIKIIYKNIYNILF